MDGLNLNRRSRWLLTCAASLGLAACGGGNPSSEIKGAASPLASGAVGRIAGLAQAQPPGQALAANLQQAKDSQSALREKLKTVSGYNVKLSEPSVAERFAEEEGRARSLAAAAGESAAQGAAATLSARRQAYDRELQTQQDELGARIQGLGARVTLQNRHAINLVTIEATAEQAQAIAALPGVESIQPVRMLKKPTMKPPQNLVAGVPSGIATSCNYDRSRPEVQNDYLRNSTKAELLAYHDVTAAHATNVKGQGMRVAVLDDGVDYTHVAMGGPGTAAMLNRAMNHAAASNASHLATAMFPYPGSRVIGGQDFVRNDLLPFPEFVRRGEQFGDAGVLPCDYVASHGTNVIDILQTVAPEARFYAFKVCSLEFCPDSAIIAALNRSLDPDRTGISRKVDVVNMSLGQSAGRLANDLIVEAVNNIAKSGVLVVMAAGNDGPVGHVISSAAVAPKGTAVAEVQGPARKRSNGDPLDLSIMEFSSSSGPSTDDMAIKPEIGAIGKVITANAGTGHDSAPFGGTSGATPVVSGVYALLRQKYPSLTPAQLRARLVNTSRPGAVWGGRTQQGLVLSRFSSTGFYVTDWSQPAHRMVAATQQNNAPGPFLVSARTPVPAMRLGGGEAHANAALRAPVMFYAVDDSRDGQVPGDTVASYPAAANFGRLSVSQVTTLPAKTLWVENLGPIARTFSVAATFRDPAKQSAGAVQISFSAGSITVPAGGRASLTMTLRIDPAKLAAANQFKAMDSLNIDPMQEINPTYRTYADECSPTDALCLMKDIFDGKIELRDASETLRLPWHVLPLRGSNVLVELAHATNGQPLLRFTNRSTAQAGAAEVFDWLGHAGTDNARVQQGRAHIRAWGAREVQFDVKSGEVTQGFVDGTRTTRRGIEVVYLLDRNTYFQAGMHPAKTVSGLAVWGSSILKLGVDVDGDGRCGNQAWLEFKFRGPLPGETGRDYEAAYDAARTAFRLSKQRMNTAAQASDAIYVLVPTAIQGPGVNLPGENDRMDYTPWGAVNLLKVNEQMLRGRHLEEWAADSAYPNLRSTNQRNIGGVGINYGSGLVVSFIIPIDDSPQFFRNSTVTRNGDRFISKPGSPAPITLNVPGGTPETAFGAAHYDNIIEGLRLNPNQASVTLCPIIGDADLETDRFYGPKPFTLGGPRFQVQGLTPRNGAVAVAAGNAVVTRNLTTNNAQHPALGVLVRSWQDAQHVSLISLP